ncbi:FxLYD domain-containing protein [Candidatus Bathycorpusculum sp.]|uniref:FxLYD domain-containing protein n=1 Tax=Candidatus Bathycorpusculum sp. TaxID=2994959 RepID=UPI00282E7F26|nr:FxLYD domain-containing protein [Candidatus Termitimicrobium sp.]MCL2686158.1 FxLYD domain-containing protein [Candidatus Termitimicrobium sp.]
MKKTQVVCLLFLIFVITLSPFTLSNPANAQTSSLKVLDNYNWYFDQVGLLVVIAEVQNTGPNTISKAVIGGTLTLSDGSTSETFGWLWGYNLIPQQKAPVYLEFSSPDSLGWGDRTFSKIEFNVASADPTADYFYSDMAITDDKGIVAKDGTFWVEGTLKNTGTQDAKETRIIATYFTEQGKLAGVGLTDPINLSPSQTTSFKVGARDLNQTVVPEDLKIASYSLLIQVTGTVLQGTPPIIVETPTPGPISVATKDPVASASIDPSITYIAIIIVVVVIVVAVLFLFKKTKASATKTQPDEPKQNTKKPKK